MLGEIIFGVVAAIFVVGMLLTNKFDRDVIDNIIKYLGFGEKGIDTLKNVVDSIVEGLEQRKQNGELTAEQCKQIALELAKEERDKLEIEISDEILNLIVEGAVFGVNLFLGNNEDTKEPEE